jgi:SAM-dependent methyltransferase
MLNILMSPDRLPGYSMSDGVIVLSDKLSAGVQAEVEILDGSGFQSHLQALLRVGSPEEYWQIGHTQAPYQYAKLFESLPPGSKILDVGVGFGQSSVYLATRGHSVFAVEPSLSMCKLICETARRFSLAIEPVQGVGENLSRIGITDFDAVVFNASLHHCDQPVDAIAEAYKCLRAGGQLVLVNESILKPWTSQKRFKRLLEVDPVGMGHYGGNEHAYHNRDYLRMIMTSFPNVELLCPNVELLIPRMDSALDELEILLSRKFIDKTRIYSTNFSVLSRFVLYILKQKLRRHTDIYKFFARLSLLPVHFRAYKQV